MPLALLAGRSIAGHHEDSADLSRTVRVSAVAMAILQTAAFAIASTVPLLAPLRPALLGIASLLAVGVVLLWLGHWRAWTASTISASMVLLIALLTVGAPWIESHVSTRAAAAAVVANRKPGEALLAERFLVRGLTYYSRQTPVVLAGTPRPYFSPHPLPVVVGTEGLAKFVHEHPSTLCLIESRSWPRYSGFMAQGDSFNLLWGGEKSLYRIERALARSTYTP